MTDLKHIKWVWLDLDDTIIDFAACARSALLRLYEIECFGRFFPEAEQWVECYERHNHRLWADYSAGVITRDRLRIERFRRPFAEAGAAHDEAMDMARRYDTFYLDLLATEKRLLPGALRLMQTLHEDRRYRTGILSNGFKEVQFRKIDFNGLTPYIDLVVLSDDIGHTKPDVHLYRHAMQRAGSADPAEHLMVGDNPATDIDGALHAGWKAVWFDRKASGAQAPQGATRIVTLAELGPLLGLQEEKSIFF